MIENMSEQEKSVMLGELAGISVLGVDGHFPVTNLYAPANMALAWRCHLWALQASIWEDYYRWCRLRNKPGHPWYARQDAQTVWLDKILELAIEAGLIKLETST